MLLWKYHKHCWILTGKHISVEDCLPDFLCALPLTIIPRFWWYCVCVMILNPKCWYCIFVDDTVFFMIILYILLRQYHNIINSITMLKTVAVHRVEHMFTVIKVYFFIWMALESYLLESCIRSNNVNVIQSHMKTFFFQNMLWKSFQSVW